MDALIMTAQLILALSILVTLHELGHFWAARAFGIKVDKFYLFFDAWNFKLFSIQRGGTEYGIGWLPLGGYVKIAGMVDESMDIEQLEKPAQPWEFRSKPAWQRLIVMIGGVTMNLILGVTIFTCLLMFSKKEYLPNSSVTKGIVAYKLGEQVGFKTGDKLLSINGKSFERFDDIYSSDVLFGANITVLREGKETTVVIPDDFYRTLNTKGRWEFIGAGPQVCMIKQFTTVENAEKAGLKIKDKILAVNDSSILTPEQLIAMLPNYKNQNVKVTIKRDKEIMNFTVMVNDSGRIGIAPSYGADIDPSYLMAPYTFTKALSYGAGDAFEAITSTVAGLGKIFQGKEKATESLQGPIGIATLFGAQWDWLRFWTLTGLLSMVLAFMNILPIPALDGGHVVFLLGEMVTGRKPSDKLLERAQVAGMVILLTLMVFVFGNDLWKLFNK
ncbi:MAG: RIP metalloprotease RseP [Bacteroidia bacterium]